MTKNWRTEVLRYTRDISNVAATFRSPTPRNLASRTLIQIIQSALLTSQEKSH
jgi:hypothetical protein